MYTFFSIWVSSYYYALQRSIVLAYSYHLIFFPLTNTHTAFSIRWKNSAAAAQPAATSIYHENCSQPPAPTPRFEIKKKDQRKKKLLALNCYVSCAIGWNGICFTLGYSHSILFGCSLCACVCTSAVACSGFCCALCFIFHLLLSNILRPTLTITTHIPSSAAAATTTTKATENQEIQNTLVNHFSLRCFYIG